ncbi:hypothetical protein [Hydrogenophaga sp. 2FB]|uniref:hypothetical protein n=1 Tax=Hydrogenophaga sp. 2FB TaxID=2502187 RepID=UPI0010F9B187|nr:hypothetical protein [Hydrogenophaga sp. 2FB]
MNAPWKVHAETWLMSPESPFVLTSGSLRLLAESHHLDTGDRAPANATFFRWLKDMTAAHKLIEVTHGVYLNRLGHRSESPSAAASFVRRGAVVSLAYVLEQAGLTNNFGETFTCVIPTHPSWTTPQLSERHVPGLGTFRFHAMRVDRLEPQGAKTSDIYDLRFNYKRTTPEKALLDWIYLANTKQSKLTAPALDINANELDPRRLKRLARKMGIEAELMAWMERWQQYQNDPEVDANASRFEIG